MRLLIERELLRPLPSLRLQIGAPSVLRKVDRLSCVRYASARYSVPTRLIGTRVAVAECGRRDPGLERGVVAPASDDEPLQAIVSGAQELEAFAYPTILEALRGTRGIATTFDYHGPENTLNTAKPRL